MKTRLIRSLLATGLTVCFAPLSLAATGDIFVANYLSNSVDEFTTSGALVGTFVTGGSGGLSAPVGAHFGPDRNLYVADQTAIKVYDGVTGAYLRDFAAASRPLDFAFDGGGNLYVVDNVQVSKYDATGALVRTYSAGVSTPQGIAFDSLGHLLVTNTYGGAYRNTVSRIDPADGSFTTFATGLGEPVGIARGADSRYYVGNYTYAIAYGGTNPDTVQVVEAGGGPSATWNTGGNLFGTSYLAFVGDTLYVSSYYNDTVQMFDATTGASIGGFDSGAGSHPQGIAYLAPVPEPSTLALSALGVLALLAVSARRRRGG